MNVIYTRICVSDVIKEQFTNEIFDDEGLILLESFFNKDIFQKLNTLITVKLGYNEQLGTGHFSSL